MRVRKQRSMSWSLDTHKFINSLPCECLIQPVHRPETQPPAVTNNSTRHIRANEKFRRLENVDTVTKRTEQRLHLSRCLRKKMIVQAEVPTLRHVAKNNKTSNSAGNSPPPGSRRLSSGAPIGTPLTPLTISERVRPICESVLVSFQD